MKKKAITILLSTGMAITLLATNIIPVMAKEADFATAEDSIIAETEYTSDDNTEAGNFEGEFNENSAEQSTPEEALGDQAEANINTEATDPAENANQTEEESRDSEEQNNPEETAEASQDSEEQNSPEEADIDANINEAAKEAAKEAGMESDTVINPEDAKEAENVKKAVTNDMVKAQTADQLKALELARKQEMLNEQKLVQQKELKARIQSENALEKESKKATQSIINGILDQFARDNPTLVFLVSPLKMIVGEVFGINNSPDPNKVIIEKIDELNQKLDDMEYSLKQHSEDLAVFTPIGGKFQAVTDAIIPLEDKIGDYQGQLEEGEITEEEYNKKIAALYDSGEYNALAQALAGATNAYRGDTSYSMDPKSIFRAAYDLQCDKVMFSGEAVDCMTPYIFRQLATYLNGYATLNTVLDGYEAVNGTNSTKHTRNTMYTNLEDVMKLYVEFYAQTYRYTFVNQSSNPANHVRLNKDITVVFGFSDSMLGKGVRYSSNAEKYTPKGLKEYPLNKEQMNRLAEYARRKNRCIYDILLDDAGFTLNIYPNLTVIGFFGLNYDLTSLNENTKINVPMSGEITLKELIRQADNTYMPSGPQVFTVEQEHAPVAYAEPPAYNYMQAIQINKAGAGDTKLCVGATSGSRVNATMLMFTRP